MIQRWSRAVREGFACGALLIVCLPVQALAQTPPAGVTQLSGLPALMQQAELRPSDLGPRDFYGGEVLVSADGSMILASAVGTDCSAGQRCGAVYVFSRRLGIWRQEARLTASDPAPLDLFGASMALSESGDIALIGAGNKDCSKGMACGAAYVFTRRAEGVWEQQQKLVSSELDQHDNFGSAAALSRDGATALIGAFGVECSNGASGCGAVYEFVRNGASWSEVGKITVPFRLVEPGFGSTLALSEDGQTLLVEEAFSGLLPGIGSVYVFQRSGGSWIQEARIDTPESCDAFFGSRMDLSDDGGTALISVKAHPFCPPSPTQVYVYTRQGGSWSQQAELIPAEGSLSGGVALLGDGNEALLGLGETTCTGGLNARVASVFTRNSGTWGEQGGLFVQNLRPAVFSASVGLSGAAHLAAVGGYAECNNGSSPLLPAEASTVLVFGGQKLADVPALSGPGLLAMALALAACGAALLLQRRAQA